MATFSVVVGDPESGQAHQVDVDDQDANRFAGKAIGDTVDGSAVGLDGFTLEITGGSDAAGRPLNAGVAGGALQEVLMAERQTGYHPRRDGERRRITVRGREIGEAVVQINTAIVEHGDGDVADLLSDE